MSGSQPATEPAPPVENLDTNVFQETTPTTPDANAESSTATETGETRETLLEATRRALAEADPPPADTKDQATESEDSAKADAPKDGEAEPSAKTEETPSDADKDEPPPFHKHPRWQEMQRDRAALRAQVEEIAPLAERQREILGFMERHELTPDDVRQGFAIMAALRTDPGQAWKLMEPIVRSVRAYMGDELPGDLQERVDQGLVDEDTARETARLRHQQSFLAERQQRQAQRQVQQQTVEQVTQAEMARVSAVDTWFAGKQADPDFGAIAPFVEGETLRMQARWRAEGRSFEAPARATALMEQVWTDLRTKLKPQRAPIRSTPTAPRSPTGTSAARPASMLDAVRAAASRPA